MQKMTQMKDWQRQLSFNQWLLGLNVRKVYLRRYYTLFTQMYAGI